MPVIDCQTWLDCIMRFTADTVNSLSFVKWHSPQLERMAHMQLPQRPPPSSIHPLTNRNTSYQDTGSRPIFTRSVHYMSPSPSPTPSPSLSSTRWVWFGVSCNQDLQRRFFLFSGSIGASRVCVLWLSWCLGLHGERMVITQIAEDSHTHYPWVWSLPSAPSSIIASIIINRP